MYQELMYKPLLHHFLSMWTTETSGHILLILCTHCTIIVYTKFSFSLLSQCGISCYTQNTNKIHPSGKPSSSVYTRCIGGTSNFAMPIYKLLCIHMFPLEDITRPTMQLPFELVSSLTTVLLHELNIHTMFPSHPVCYSMSHDTQ